MSARDEILERVRRGVGKGDFAGRRAAAERYMAERKLGPQPTVSGDLVARFREKAESLASTVAEVVDLASAAGEAARYLKENALSNAAVIAPELADIAWAEAGLAVAARSAVDADAVGITGCFCAVAETGTLMLLSGAATPATVSLLPETHIALVPTNRIVATMEEAFALLRAERGELPRAVNFISGPSRTGDIEQTIVLGAHGPCRVHLILVGDKTTMSARDLWRALTEASPDRCSRLFPLVGVPVGSADYLINRLRVLLRNAGIADGRCGYVGNPYEKLVEDYVMVLAAAEKIALLHATVV